MNEKTKKAKIIAALRLLHRQWEPKKLAKNDGRKKVVDGFFKNGAPKYRWKYSCAKCAELFNVDEIDMDHIEPVISVDDGFTDYNSLISDMFSPQEKYQRLCKPCHKAKSKIENAERRKNVKAKNR